MFATARHHMRLLLAVAIAAMCASSAAEARHWRYRWHHFHDPYQGLEESQQPGLHTFGNHPSGNAASGFGRGIEQMIGACQQQAAELKRMPIDLVSRTVQGNDDQGNALEQVRSAANGAADTLAAACPKETPAELDQRLDRLGAALDAIAASLASLRPALASFYDSLDDEQKARLVAIDFSRKPQPDSDRGARPPANGVADTGSKAEQDPVCHQWVVILRSWPVGQIENAISLSDEQHAALHDVAAAMYRATGTLVATCPAEDRLTPLGRLDAKQKQLQALRQGIDAIAPVLSAFENSLNEAQKTRLAAVVNGSLPRSGLGRSFDRRYGEATGSRRARY